MRVAEGARFSVVVFVAGHVPVAIPPVKSMRMGEKKAWYPASLIRLLILVWLAYGEDGAAQGRVDIERRGTRPVGALGQVPQVVAGFGVALPDRAGVRGGTVEQGGRRTGRREPADGGQVAGPVPRVEAGRPAGRAEAGQTGDDHRPDDRGPAGGDAGGDAEGRDALDPAADGRAHRDQQVERGPHLARVQPQAPSGGRVQAVERPAVRGQGA